MGADADTGWYIADDGDLEEFRRLVEQTTDPADYPHADAVEQGVLVYGERACATADGAAPAQRRALQAEIARPGGRSRRRGRPRRLPRPRRRGPGHRRVGRPARGGAQRRRPGGRPFAAPGADDRLWGALDKLALRDPLVRPGGRAQVAHRDYHLGFMSREQALAYPPTSTGSRGRCRARWPTAPCRWSAGPTMLLRTRRSSGRATSPSRSRRATLCSSTPRCSTRRDEPVGRRPPDGEPAAGVVGVRPGHGGGRPHGGVQGAVPRPARATGGGRRGSAAAQRRRGVPPRATPSRPTSTATSRSAGSRPRRRPSWSGGRCSRAGPRARWPRSSTPSRPAARRPRADPLPSPS
jgi:hypothetical protein